MKTELKARGIGARATRSVAEQYEPSADYAAGLLLDEHGIVRDCDSASEMLFGHRRSDMVARHVSMLLPQLAGIELLKDGQPNSKLRFHCRIGVRYQVLKRNGESFPCELFLNRLDNPGSPPLRLIVRRAEPA